MPSVKIDSLHAKKEGLSFNTWSSLIAQMSILQLGEAHCERGPMGL